MLSAQKATRCMHAAWARNASGMDFVCEVLPAMSKPPKLPRRRALRRASCRHQHHAAAEEPPSGTMTTQQLEALDRACNDVSAHAPCLPTRAQPCRLCYPIYLYAWQKEPGTPAASYHPHLPGSIPSHGATERPHRTRIPSRQRPDGCHDS